MKLKDKILIFRDDQQTVSEENITYCDENTIETKQGIYDVNETTKRIDQTNGNILYLVNMDTPAKLEAEHLKRLRRSEALNGLFDFKTEEGIDWLKVMPWIALVLAIMF